MRGSDMEAGPDLSHLTPEERAIIESVMVRQKQEEEREQEIMRYLDNTLKHISFMKYWNYSKISLFSAANINSFLNFILQLSEIFVKIKQPQIVTYMRHVDSAFITLYERSRKMINN